MAMVVKRDPRQRRRRVAGPMGTQPVARIAAQVANSVLLNRAEHKIATIQFAFAAAPIAGTVVPITQQIVQGDDLSNRSGDKINLTRVDLSANFAVGAGSVASTARLILFTDTMANAAVPTAADLLAAVSVVGRWNAVNLLKHRFRVLADWVVPLVATASNHVVHREYLSRSRMPVFYTASTNVAAANSKNAMFVLVLSDTAVNSPGVGFDIQLQYTDN